MSKDTIPIWVAYISGVVSLLALGITAYTNLYINNAKIQADKESRIATLEANLGSLEKTLEFNKESFEKTMDANSSKLRADLLAQSSKTYKELVTSERIVWIGLLRESMAEFLCTAHEILTLRADFSDSPAQSSFQIQNLDIIKEFHKSSYLIQLRLNPKEEEFLKILLQVSQIVLDTSSNLILAHQAVCGFANVSQNLLKIEWDKVKEEARELNGLDASKS